MFLGLVTETTATQKGEDKAQHTKKTVWTSKRAREALRNRHKNFSEGISKPQWLDDEITKRNKAMTNEEKEVRKTANPKKPGAAKAGEPDWSDGGLGGHEPTSRRRSRSRGARRTTSRTKNPRVNGSATLRATSAAARTKTARLA